VHLLFAFSRREIMGNILITYLAQDMKYSKIGLLIKDTSFIVHACVLPPGPVSRYNYVDDNSCLIS
jgi:hypothetical protein